MSSFRFNIKMENVYHLVSDNINEIIYISYDGKISYNISIANKSFSNYIYDVHRILIKHAHSRGPLIRFRRMTELLFSNN